METNAAGQNLAQAVEDGFNRRLLEQRGGHIEQGSISAIGGRQSSIVFRHGHRTSTWQLNRKPIANTSAVDICLLKCTLASRFLPTFVLWVRGFVRARLLHASSHCGLCFSNRKCRRRRIK